MSIKAKFPGKCPLCFERFVVDNTTPDRINSDDIENKNGKWVHVDCKAAKALQNTPGTNYSSNKQNYKDYSQKATRNVPVAVSDTDSDDISNAFASAVDAVPVEVHHEEKVFTPSVYQKAIYEALEQMVKGVYHKKHLIVEAVAGSGKTTTIVHALKLIPDSFEVAFIAFNKHIAFELKKRAPAYVHVSTLHSLGLEIIRNNIEKVKVDEKSEKLNNILDELYPVAKILIEQEKLTKKERQENYIKRSSMRSLVSMAKSTLVDAENVEAVDQMIDRYDIQIDFKYKVEIVQQLAGVLEKCKANKQLVDFDDMIWLPVVCDMTFTKFDYLMVDEFQDMNKTQIEFIKRSISENGHIIAVGDRFQSLYGFRGADTEAIPNAIVSLDAATLPLSVTYRCPSKHVELAQRIVPQLEARENAPEGEVIQDFPYKKLVQTLQDGDMVICRTNAPLVAPAFACIRAHKKAVIRGKDGIGNQLIALVKRFETNSISELSINLSEYYTKEFEKLVDHGKELQAAMLTDKVDTIKFIMSEASTVSELIEKISLLFDDKSTGIVFSSVHRAKGLEANNVFILKSELMPHPKAKEGWQMEQEMNTLYVATTRSKDKIYIVQGGE